MIFFWTSERNHKWYLTYRKYMEKSNLCPLTRVMWTFSNWKVGLFQDKTPLQSSIVETFHKSVNQHKPSQEQSNVRVHIHTTTEHSLRIGWNRYKLLLCSSYTFEWRHVWGPTCVGLDIDTDTSITAIFSNYYWCRCVSIRCGVCVGWFGAS